MVEHKKARTVLSKWGNDLLQTYRTIGQASGLSDVDMHLLMNHSLPGVNAGYITRAKLLRGHLRATQETLSKMMIDTSGIEGAVWRFLAARKLGDPVRDPTPPDPRSKRAREERFWAFDAPRLLKAAMRKAELAAASQPSEPPTPTTAPQVSWPQTNGETEPHHQPGPAPPAPPHRVPVRSLLTM